MRKSAWAFRFQEGHGYGIIRAGNRKNALKALKEEMYGEYLEEEHAEYVDSWTEDDLEESRYIICEECNYITFDLDGSGCGECGAHESRKGRIGYKLNI